MVHWKLTDVIANDIPIPLLCVKFDSKSSDVSNSVCTSSASLNSREAHEHGRSTGRISKDSCRGHVFCAFVDLEVAMCSSTSCMNNALGDTLVVEAVNLLDVSADVREERGKGCATYPLSTSVIFKKVGPNLLVLVVDGLQPMVKIWNFGAIVGCGVMLAALILDIPLKVRNLLVFAHGSNRIRKRISNFSNAFCNGRSHSNKDELMKK